MPTATRRPELLLVKSAERPSWRVRGDRAQFVAVVASKHGYRHSVTDSFHQAPRNTIPFPCFLEIEMKEFKIAGGTLSLLLFIDVTNSKDLLTAMQEGTLEPEVAFLDASMIPDAFPVLAAAQKTLIAKTRELLTTRTLHSELVYNYSGSKHITESLRRCGISDGSSYVLAARFNASPEEIKAIEDLVSGKEINLDELEGRADKAKIQKHYKISGLELGISSLADAITCRIAARDAL